MKKLLVLLMVSMFVLGGVAHASGGISSNRIGSSTSSGTTIAVPTAQNNPATLHVVCTFRYNSIYSFVTLYEVINNSLNTVNSTYTNLSGETWLTIYQGKSYIVVARSANLIDFSTLGINGVSGIRYAAGYRGVPNVNNVYNSVEVDLWYPMEHVMSIINTSLQIGQQTDTLNDLMNDIADGEADGWNDTNGGNSSSKYKTGVTRISTYDPDKYKLRK